jgi:hypothetical protein
MPDEAVSIQLEYLPAKRGARGGPMSRIEWRSLGAHGNKGIGPEKYRFKQIKECHEHCFHLNWAHSESQVRRGNLPIAIPLESEYTTFMDVLDFAANRFNIKDVTSVPEPPWEARLL